MKVKNSGFTLIELLVVISIIAVLSTIGLATYQSVYKNSRDVKRQSDLKLIQSALEQYRADQDYYPLYSNTCTDGSLTFGSSSSCGLKDTLGSKLYISSVPSDPLNSNLQYSYQPQATSSGGSCDNSTTKCLYYQLCANLENPPSGSTTNGCGSSYNLQVTPP